MQKWCHLTFSTPDPCFCVHKKRKIIDGKKSFDGAWPKQIEKQDIGHQRKHDHHPFSMLSALTFKPRSSSVLSSTDWAITFHLQSTSLRYPR